MFLLALLIEFLFADSADVVFVAVPVDNFATRLVIVVFGGSYSWSSHSTRSQRSSGTSQIVGKIYFAPSVFSYLSLDNRGLSVGWLDFTEEFGLASSCVAERPYNEQ